MTESEKFAIKNFVEYWRDKGSEKQEAQTFWNMLLREVLGVKPEGFIRYEEKVALEHQSFMDGIIDTTHVLIEQKSSNVNLLKPEKQSSGEYLTPFQQAKRYNDSLGYSRKARWIVTCNFKEMHIYDMEFPQKPPEKLLISDLVKESWRLQFIVDPQNENIKRETALSIAAGDLIGEFYDTMLKQYKNPEATETFRSLNVLCVRLVFCLYAEDAGLFGSHTAFHDYIKSYDTKSVRGALINLFKILNQKPEERDPYLDEELLAFPYVNGGLFADDNIEIPQFTEELLHILLSKASEKFNWSEISPTIFGAVFESTLNPETRRSGGMHYTSIENIHKVIDPLFLNSLNKEFTQIANIKVEKTRNARLDAFTDKLAKLNFLDPACGSGNFLTETYLSLRKLENKAIQLRNFGQLQMLDAGNVIKVSIGQFYGIEINDFAVTVAKTALWIAESQMMQATAEIVHAQIDFLPLHSYANIVEGNALRLDWETIISKQKLNYIMGNPPFVGARQKNNEQTKDIQTIFAGWKNNGNLDYVSCWYKKSADYIHGTNIHAAFVSTNSITQGEQVAILWKPLFNEGLHFDFAYRTFMWDSEAEIKAHVYCVIIGFSKSLVHTHKVIFDDNTPYVVKNINAYLVEGENVFVESRSTPICQVPPMVFGSMPNDGGYLSNYSEEEKNTIIKRYPQAEIMFKRIVGAEEFINNKTRWCLWLKGISPILIKSVPAVLEAIKKVAKMRTESNREATRKLADKPMLFGEIRQPENGNYLIIPRVSSETRRYVPIGFMSSEVIASDAAQIVPNATLYEFGVLTSSVHMAWMRAVAGRLEMRYRYSASIVYNNFPWCTSTTAQKAEIESTAQAILDARALYSECSLSDLYGKQMYLYPELRKAHQANDKAVMQAYGFSVNMTESEIVAELMNKYQILLKRETR